jgi:hypothetical protein
MVMRKVEPPTSLRPVIHARLKPRWELKIKPFRFATARQEIVVDELLPAETQVNYLVSRLRNVAREHLSAEEKRLARWVQIILPDGAGAEDNVPTLQALPCFAEVHVAPQPSLPKPGGYSVPS